MQVTSGKYKLDDYNFETPSTDLLGIASGADTSLAMYEYPAGRMSKDAVEALANRRFEEVDLSKRLLRGASSNAGMRPGHTFRLADHPRQDANAEYVAWRVWHQSNQDVYSNTFEAFPADTPFRPPLVTALPGSTAARPRSSSARPARRSGPISTGGSR